ncbi:MAG: 50S ribosomal protein L16, partial [Patescibacteria group bacterium]
HRDLEARAGFIEAARKVLTKYTSRGGKVWIRAFPHQSITNKGSQSTMGGGKGVPEYFIALVKPGNILFELEGIPRDQAQKALITAAYKLPLKAKFIEKN